MVTWKHIIYTAVKRGIIMTGEDNYRNLCACWPRNVKLRVMVGGLGLKFEIISKNEN